LVNFSTVRALPSSKQVDRKTACYLHINGEINRTGSVDRTVCNLPSMQYAENTSSSRDDVTVKVMKRRHKTHRSRPDGQKHSTVTEINDVTEPKTLTDS